MLPLRAEMKRGEFARNRTVEFADERVVASESSSRGV